MINWKNSVKPKSQDKAILSRASKEEGAETTGVPARASNTRKGEDIVLSIKKFIG